MEKKNNCWKSIKKNINKKLGKKNYWKEKSLKN
jgi:hypothetical protein